MRLFCGCRVRGKDQPVAPTTDPSQHPIPISGTASAGASSLLSAFHPLPAAPGTYPTQRYRLPAPDDDGPRPIRLLLKPVALDIPGPAGEDGESPKQGSEPALILYGRAVVEEGSSSSTSSGQGDACIHSLALRVGEFLTPVEGGGAVAQAEGGVDSEGRVVVRIKGAGGGEGGAWWCRLGALGDR